jgi:hypothetical protein
MAKARKRPRQHAHRPPAPPRLTPKPPTGDKATPRDIASLRRRMPQVWVQIQRMSKIVELQRRNEGQQFAQGSCFLHAHTATVSHFCVKRVLEIDLSTLTVTLEIHSDADLAEGIVVLPLEQVGWFGFPASAVPTDTHLRAFQELMPSAPLRPHLSQQMDVPRKHT